MRGEKQRKEFYLPHQPFRIYTKQLKSLFSNSFTAILFWNDVKSNLIVFAGYPYFVGMLQYNEETAEKLLQELELLFGVQSTSNNYMVGSYQWGKING